MPNRGNKFILEFLLPNLNTKRFGTRLMWLNEKHSIFQVQWCHKSATDWTSYDAEVFMEWDKMKGRLALNDVERFTKSKQRFRAILYKLIKTNHIGELSSDKFTKIYCLGSKENIPEEVIDKALKSRESREKSPEQIYNCDPEKVIDIKSTSIFEEHQYANLQEMVEIETGVMVPDNQIENCNPSAIESLYVQILREPLFEPFPKFDDGLEDSNDYNLTDLSGISSNVRWEENSEIVHHESSLNENSFGAEYFLNS